MSWLLLTPFTVGGLIPGMDWRSALSHPSVSLITDRDTGRPKGSAFVEMSTEQAAEAAITGLNGQQLDEREIKVDKAKPQADRDRRGSNQGRSRW